MEHLRTYGGPAGFITYLSLWIGTVKFGGPGFLFDYLWWGYEDILEAIGIYRDVLISVIMAGVSLVFLSVCYGRMNSKQKQYIAICGETHVCFFASSFLLYLFFKLNFVSMITASS